MKPGVDHQGILVGLLDALYREYGTDLPASVRFPLGIVLSIAHKATPKQFEQLKTATRADIQKAIFQSELATKNAAWAAVTAGQIRETVDRLYELCTKGSDALQADVREALFYSWRTHEDLRKFLERIGDLQSAPAFNPLHQLRPAVADFVGREAEIVELMENIAERGATISGVQGMGGVGKTELALVLAGRLEPDYPDAQFYLDLRGTSPKPLRAADALAHVIRRFHLEEKLPEEEGQLRGLYQSVLHGKRVLLLMDNAAGAEQVEPLIPPAGCVLLVTSRQRFTLPGLFGKNLDTLPPAEARELLLTIAERIGDRADEIAKLCGYLPLALRLAGSALAERPALSPDDYVRRLSDKQERLEHLDKVDASLSLSDELFDAELRRLWYALAVFPADFDRAAAAAVWQLDADQAQDALDKLVGYSVLEWNDKTRRFRLHDLVRLFADRRLADTDRAAAELRHATYYGGALATASLRYLQGGQDVAKGLALFDLEWPNIKAGFGWAKAHAATDETAARLCSTYPSAGAVCLNLRQHPLEQIAWLEPALATARRLHDRGEEGAHLGNLGNAYLTLGEPRRAIEFYEQQLVIKREIGERRGEGNALGSLGNACADLGQPRRAIEFYEQCLTVHREIADRRGEGNDLGNLGRAYAALGQHRRAIEFYEQALVIHREIGERRGEGSSLGNLGRAYAALGQHRRAIEFYEQRMEVAREMGDRRAEGNALANLGNAHDDQGEPSRAIEFYEQYLAITREIGDRRGEGNALGNLGNAYQNLGAPRRAIEFYEQQLVIAGEIADRRGEANASWNLGVVYEQQGDLGRAVELMQVCVDFEREIGHADAEEHAAHVAALLDAQPRRLWYALAVFPADFDRAAAAAVWGLDADQAQDALDKLVRYSVLQWNEKTGRFRLHDLVRLYADRPLADADRAAVELRHAIHYAEVAASADRQYLQGGQDVAKGLALFDLEWPNIKAGFGWASAHAATDERAAILCSAYPQAGASCLPLRLHPRERIAWLEAAVAAARRLHDRAAEANLLGNLGVVYTDLGEPRRAIGYHEEALAISREIADRRGEGACLANLALAYRNLGDPQRAIELYEQALVIDRDIADRRGEANDLGNLGVAYGALGEFRRAIGFFEQQLVITREIGDRRGEGNALGNLGTGYRSLGEAGRAIEFYEQQLAITREIGHRHGEATASWNLGDEYAEQGDLSRAVESMQVCVDYEREIGHVDAEEHAAHVEALRARMGA